MKECEKKEQTIYAERTTGQILIPGIITTNPECDWSTENGFGQGYTWCDEGKITYDNEEYEDCPKCKGTGKLYEEIRQ
jgi:hypothetical protein